MELSKPQRHRLVLTVFGLLLTILLGASGYYHYTVTQDALKHRIHYFKETHENTYLTIFFLTDKVQSAYNQLLGDKYIAEWTQNPTLLLMDMYNLSVIQNTFSKLINSNNEIESIYLHNRKNNIILSSKYLLSEREQFPHRQVFDAFYNQEQGAVWLPADKETAAADRLSPNISYAAGLLNNGKFGTVVINVNGGNLRKQLEPLNRYVLWLDANDRLLYSSRQELRETYAGMKEKAEGNGQWDNEDHYVFVSTDPKKSWKVVTMVPKAELLSHVGWKTPYLFSLLALLLLLIVSFILYLRKTYGKPIQAYTLNLKKNIDDLQHNFFVNLFSGKLKSGNIHEEGREFGLDLDGGYQVIVFEIDDYYNHLLTMDGENRFFMNKNVFNSIKWTFAVRFKAYSVKTEFEKVTVLLCRRTGPEQDEPLEETIRYLQNDIKDNCHLTVCAGISRLFHELDRAPIEYVNALRSLEYKTLYGKHSIIYYNDISARHSPADGYPLKQINELLDCLRRGETEKLKACLDRMFDEFTGRDTFNPHWIAAILTSIMSDISKFVIESRYSMRDIFEEDVFMTLYSYDMLEDKKNYIRKVCLKLVDYRHNHEEDMRNQTSRMIMDYIHNNYDKTISLTIIADSLQMNPSYVSAFIKKHMGIRFVGYVNKLRIQKSIALLSDADLSVQQIAERCGYDTVHSFIRNFKKTYHVPPNEYRLQMKKSRIQKAAE